MSQLRTRNAKRAVLKINTSTGNTTRSAKLILVASRIGQGTAPKAIVRELARRRLIPRQ